MIYSKHCPKCGTDMFFDGRYAKSSLNKSLKNHTLEPKKFWRYNKKTNTFKNVLEQ